MKQKTLILLLLLTISNFFYSQKLITGENSDSMRKLIFKNISVNDGLSQYAVMSITQDQNGFMWIGTYDGLNRYDGFNVVSIRRIYNDTTSLMNNRILSLAVKSKKELWIGSQDGLILYDNPSQKFRSIAVATKDLSSSRINSIFIDRDSNLWIGTEKGLVVGYKKNNDSYLYIAHNCCKNMHINGFSEHKDGSIWMATTRGAYIINKKKHELSLQILDGTSDINIFITYRDKSDRMWVSGDNYLAIVKTQNKNYYAKRIEKQILNSENLNIRAFVEDTVNSSFWIGTWKHAIFNFKINQNEDVYKIIRYNDSFMNGGLADNDIRTLFIDQSNVLWVGTRNGVSYTDLSPKKFQRLQLFENNNGEMGLKKKYINSLFVDSDNKLWINIYQMGLFVYDLNNNTITDATSRVTSNSIMEILETKSGDLWFGSFDGVYRLSKTARKSPNSRAERISTDLISELMRFRAMMIEDKNGCIWFTINDRILRYYPEKKSYIEYSVKDGLPTNQGSYQIFYTPDSNFIWINAIHNGISKVYFNNQNNQLRIESFASDTNMANRFLWQLFVDKNNVMWVGTDTGLDKIDMNRETKKVEHFDNPIIRNSKVTFIANDKSNNLWIGSSQGLYSIDMKTNEVQRYTHEDGLQSNSFTDAVAKSKDGIIYVGGINGINYFNPQKIIKNKFPVKGAFVALRINNKDIAINEESYKSVPLTQDINYIDKIELNYKQNNFTLEFAALHFASSKRNLYKYMLEGYDAEWVEVDGNHRFASYSNLPSGTYKFKLLTSNNDKIWTDTPRELMITVLPPPWRTIWAYIFYTLIVGLILFFILKYITEKQLWKNKLVIQQLEKQKEHELNEMKLSFFTNITHELRTPLVLILGPLRDLINWGGSHEEFISYRLKIINKNANKLLNLINQILNVRSMSTNHLPLSVAKRNIVRVVEDTVKSFQYYADKNEVSLVFQLDKTEDFTETWFDQDKIEKILQNLISNALKFTPQYGKIEVKMWQKEESHRIIYISVEDNGSGIEPALLKNIFDLYSKGALNKEFSSGIGLCFSKLLIEAHQGSIKVESEPEIGSIFTISFPIDKECFAPESIIVINLEEESETIDKEKNESGKSKRLVLIVEDNNDMRKYIKECLKNDFDIVEAKDGIEGLTLSKKLLPNAIITDLMMPGIDGATLLDSIRKDTRTSFIPVVVHSVLDDKNIIQELLSKGANEYIVKPFEPNILIYKINSLLSIQDDFAKKMRNETLLKPEDVEIESSDEKLLKKISKIVEDNLQNPDLDADLVSSIIGMSRMQLYRRLKQISGGKQLSEIILSMRLERAAQLLASGEKRISEVMDESGFNNNTRFKNYFVNAFGVTPSEYKKAHNK